MKQLSDEELAGKAVTLSTAGQGPNPYLDELFSRHYRKVALWCLRYTGGNRESAADLTQEVFLRVQRNLESFAGHSQFSTWLYTITRNHCLNAVKSKRDVDSITGMDYGGPLPDLESQMDRSKQEEQAQEWIQSLLDTTERKVFTMHYSDEIPLEGITRLLGLTNASGAKAYIVSARRKLHEAVRRTIDVVLDHPRVFPAIPDAPGGEARRALIRPWQYWLIFEVRELDATIVVFALWNARRRPEGWRDE